MKGLGFNTKGCNGKGQRARHNVLQRAFAGEPIIRGTLQRLRAPCGLVRVHYKAQSHFPSFQRPQKVAVPCVLRWFDLCQHRLNATRVFETINVGVPALSLPSPAEASGGGAMYGTWECLQHRDYGDGGSELFKGTIAECC